MKRLIATALLITVSVFAVPKAHSASSYESTVRWAGCKNAAVVEDPNIPAVSSFYMSTRETAALSKYTGKDIGTFIVIGTKDTPQSVTLIVLLHETGHCLQDEMGYIDKITTLQRELDADRWAANLACGLNLDGRRLLHDAFVWMKKTYDYNGYPWHGTLEMRIRQADKADRCNVSSEHPVVNQP